MHVQVYLQLIPFYTYTNYDHCFIKLLLCTTLTMYACVEQHVLITCCEKINKVETKLITSHKQHLIMQ